jgi:SAM-dependent methyltransferase
MYTEEQCKAYMEAINSVGSDGLLQIYRLSRDPLTHAREIHVNVTGELSMGGRGVILDAGCGTGEFLHLLRLHRLAETYIGINKFQCQLPELSVQGYNTLFHCGDITSKDVMNDAHVAENSVDCAYCNYTIGHLGYVDMHDAMKNIYSVLKVNGRFGIWDMIPATIGCDTVLDYKLWTPDVVCGNAERIGFTTVKTMIFDRYDCCIAKSFKKLVTKEQCKAIKRLAKPVLYVFRK